MYLADKKWFENLKEYNRREEIDGYKDLFDYGEFYFVNNYAVTNNILKRSYIIGLINNRDKRYLIKVLNTETGKIKYMTVTEWHDLLLSKNLDANMAVNEKDYLYLAFKNTVLKEKEVILTPNIAFYRIGEYHIYYWVNNQIKKAITYEYDFSKQFRSFSCYGTSIKFDDGKYIDFKNFFPELLLYDNVSKKDFIEKANSGLFDIIDKMSN